MQISCKTIWFQQKQQNKEHAPDQKVRIAGDREK